MKVRVVKQGKKYSALQVEKLYAQCVCWMPMLTDFCVITDDAYGFHPRISTMSLPAEPYLQGWWSKLYQFSLPVDEPTIGLDIDLQIRGPFNPSLRGKLYAPRDPLCDIKHEIEYINSSIMLYDRSYRHIWDHYVANWRDIQQQYRGDQEYLWGEFREEIEYLGDYIESFKWGWGRKHGFAKKTVVLYHGEDVKSYV